MLGCHIGRCFQVTIAGGSYQEGLATIVQGHPPGMLITEQEIYSDLLLRKPGSDELCGPRVGRFSSIPTMREASPAGSPPASPSLPGWL